MAVVAATEVIEASRRKASLSNYLLQSRRLQIEIYDSARGNAGSVRFALLASSHPAFSSSLNDSVPKYA